MEKRFAIYARTSTSTQVTGLEAQVRALREFCARNGISNYLLFQDDGISGTKSSRPALDQMMAAVRRGEVCAVVVYSFSRFARSTTHLLNALNEFKKLGVDFKSITENIDTNSPLGSAFFTILAALSQLERDLIVERVRNGLANARAKGKQIGRKKLRDSDLIRKLLKAGLSYRAVASVAKCSHGSVHAERVAMKKEQALQQNIGADTKLDPATTDEIKAIIAKHVNEQKNASTQPPPVPQETYMASQPLTPSRINTPPA